MMTFSEIAERKESGEKDFSDSEARACRSETAQPVIRKRCICIRLCRRFMMTVNQASGAKGAAELDANRNRLPDYGRVVFIADKHDGYALGRLVDIGADKLTVQLDDASKTKIVKAAHVDVFSADENVTKDVDDNCALMYLNEATLLHNCRLRYSRRKIYTYVANILIAINPYETIADLYSDATIRAYEGRSLGVLPPHIFAVADKTWRDLRRQRQSQSIIVGGESGAGKTETQKYVLRYLCRCRDASNTGGSAAPLESRFLETNPILEAFGNAKTLRNNNSSRFGKFVEVHFDAGGDGVMVGGHVAHYLLEKTRVCVQQRGERNFHVFYQLFTDCETAVKLRLSRPADFNYLRIGCTQFFRRVNESADCVPDAAVDDFDDFKRLRKSLLDIGFTIEERDDLFTVLAGILHVGNVEFDARSDDTAGGTRLTPGGERALSDASPLLGVDATTLRLGLTSRLMQPTRAGAKGTLIAVPLRSRECAAARDALAKALYSRIFDVVVARINSSIPFETRSEISATRFIGILDIAGFEFFETNSFEQLCINYCNEKLQLFFNDRILRQEQELYANEALDVPRVQFADNSDCIELFERKSAGLFDLLDEEMRLPRASASNYAMTAQRANAGHTRLAPARKNGGSAWLRDDEGFAVRHYATTVCYETTEFLEKNNDALHESLEILLLESTNALVRALASEPSVPSSQNQLKRNGQNRPRARLAAASVSAKFRAQLAALVDKLSGTGTHFVRCLKPNAEMAPARFDGPLILDQLRCAGIASVLQLMQSGFPSRTSFAKLYKAYESVLPPRLALLEPRLFCKYLFHALGLNDSDYKFGVTKAFFRAGKFAEFDQLMRQDSENIRALVELVDTWIHRVRWRKLQIKALHDLTAFRTEIGRLREIAPNDGSKFIADVERLRRRVQSELLVNGASYESELTALRTQFNAHLEQLQAKAASDERERLRGLEKEVLERQCLAQKMAEAEAEERQAKSQLIDKDSVACLTSRFILKNPLNEDTKFTVSNKDRPSLKTLISYSRNVTTQGTQTNEADAKEGISGYNLVEWTYACLRDAINTSTNIDFLEACRDEFHRRLNAYRKWKADNETHVISSNFGQSMKPARIQRYFRVPFEKPAAVNDYRPRADNCGFWYAHFDGQFIARQMELHPSKAPLLLLAGVHDDKMCELSLDKTRLTHKKGAEISAQDFNTLWTRHGGGAYVDSL